MSLAASADLFALFPSKKLAYAISGTNLTRRVHKKMIKNNRAPFVLGEKHQASAQIIGALNNFLSFFVIRRSTCSSCLPNISHHSRRDRHHF